MKQSTYEDGEHDAEACATRWAVGDRDCLLQDNGAPSLPGAKPLGSHDHGGIGFSTDSPAAPAPPVSIYQPGQVRNHRRY